MTSLHRNIVEDENLQPSPSDVQETEEEKSHLRDDGSNSLPFSAIKRVQTAPTDSARPKIKTRSSALLAGRKDGATGAQLYSDTHDSFQYKFDSDSDSLSSSEDDDSIPAATKRPKSDQRKASTAQQDRRSKDNQERRRFFIGNDYVKTKGKVSKKDGRLKISINENGKSGYVARAIGQSIQNHLCAPRRDGKDGARSDKKEKRDEKEQSIVVAAQTQAPIPRLNIVIMVIGSRGDIQPFLKLGRILRESHGHRVRIASHPVFRDFTEKLGLEFFDVGGDPSELMAFMVKNPGLFPNMETLREGEIGKRRASMAEMFEGFWRACIADNDQNSSDIDTSSFVADAIIANPPSMAHVHIAERLGIPLHIMFTFPWTPTTQFPHPLANIKPGKSNVDAGYLNFMSYPLVELMTWQGLGDIVNRFRENTLRLEPVSSLWAPGALFRMHVPYTYMFSPGLVPKPSDWGPEIDIAGFTFLDMADDFEAPKALTDFLEAGDPPIYIGFGSIVVDDPDKFTDMIFKAVDMAGVRALVSKGWGGFGRDNSDTPENIYMLDSIPHDWLFPKVKAVVIHGGAGTTAIALKCARPTMIVPFFGDQPFWGEMVASAKAGAFQCIPYKKLTAERLAEGIKQCLTEEAQQNVQKIADSISKEGDGAENAVKSFHFHLPLSGRDNMRCSILQDKVAVWQVRKSSLRLSALAAQLLHEKGRIKWGELKLVHHHEYNDFDGPGEPITGGIGALSDTLYGVGEGLGMVPVRIARHIRKHEEHERAKRARRKQREDRKRKKAEQKTDQTATTNRDQTAITTGEQSGPVQEDTNTKSDPTTSADPSEPLPMEIIEDLGYGLKRAGTAILTMPNDLHVAIALGLHNVPRLWGDDTVRKPVKIQGVKSGFTAAGKEFAYGMYDGWSGIVTQPMHGWQDGATTRSKVVGLGTGLGKGLGGFAIKKFNAIYAPPSFVVKGFIKYAQNRSDGPGCKPHLRRSRILQGEKELGELRDSNDESSKRKELREIEERVEHGWAVYQDIWKTAREQFGPVGGNLMGKYRLKRERKHWDDHGFLENVDVADRTLQARKEGYSIDDIAARQNEEKLEAEHSKDSSLPDSRAIEDGVGVSGDAQEHDDVLTEQKTEHTDLAGNPVLATDSSRKDVQVQGHELENGHHNNTWPVEGPIPPLKKVATVS